MTTFATPDTTITPSHGIRLADRSAHPADSLVRVGDVVFGGLEIVIAAGRARSSEAQLLARREGRGGASCAACSSRAIIRFRA
jgi:hypothetical protein